MDIVDAYIQEYAAVISGPADSNAVDAILEEYGVFDALYREWLIRSGGGPIGPDWYDSLSQLRESQAKLSKESWSISGFVIGWDGAGNTMVLGEDGVIPRFSPTRIQPIILLHPPRNFRSPEKE